jgi:hypothetical protein
LVILPDRMPVICASVSVVTGFEECTTNATFASPIW